MRPEVLKCPHKTAWASRPSPGLGAVRATGQQAEGFHACALSVRSTELTSPLGLNLTAPATHGEWCAGWPRQCVQLGDSTQPRAGTWKGPVDTGGLQGGARCQDFP